MFKRVLTSLGIGSAKIDLVLPDNKFRAGELINGSLQMAGGMTDQTINQVYLQLVVESKIKKDDGTETINKTLDHAVLAKEFVIQGEQRQEIAVSYQLPESTPITTSSTRLFIVTGMDISMAIDPKDHDPVEIKPGKRQEIIMTAIENELGFKRQRLTGAYNGKYQEFEYHPGRFMRGQLDEIEVIYQIQTHGIGLFMQIDKKAKGLLGGLLDNLELDERHTSMFLNNAVITSPQNVASVIADFINQEYRKIP